MTMHDAMDVVEDMDPIVSQSKLVDIEGISKKSKMYGDMLRREKDARIKLVVVECVQKWMTSTIERGLATFDPLATSKHRTRFGRYQEKLMGLLLELDRITSDGDEEVRSARKAVVKEINGNLLPAADTMLQNCSRLIALHEKMNPLRTRAETETSSTTSTEQNTDQKTESTKDMQEEDEKEVSESEDLESSKEAESDEDDYDSAQEESEAEDEENEEDEEEEKSSGEDLQDEANRKEKEEEEDQENDNDDEDKRNPWATLFPQMFGYRRGPQARQNEEVRQRKMRQEELRRRREEEEEARYRRAVLAQRQRQQLQMQQQEQQRQLYLQQKREQERLRQLQYQERLRQQQEQQQRYNQSPRDVVYDPYTGQFYRVATPSRPQYRRNPFPIF